MKITKILSVVILMTGMSMPFQSKANDEKKAPETEMSMEAKVLMDRLEEIKSMDKSNMTSSEKKELRQEVKQIRSEMKELGGGVYLSAGALIIILLLLILIL